MQNYKIDKALCEDLLNLRINEFCFGRKESEGGHDVDMVFILPN